MQVAAVVVSFNRKQLLTECLDKLIAQSLPLDRIILVDNKSTDGTVDLLRERGYLDHPLLELVVLDTNVGGAGGFHKGLKRAVDQGYDWAWLMDDDAEPDVEAYRLCRPYLEQSGIALVAPVMADANGSPDYVGMHRGILLGPDKANVSSMGRGVTAEEAAQAPTVDFQACSFVGPFISAAAVKAIGLPRKEFFIHYDDVEYTMRLRDYGRLVLVTGALIRHKQAQLAGRMVKRDTPFGQKERVRYDKLWSTFYGYRNLSWLIWNRKVPTRTWTLLQYHLRLLIGIILYDDNKLGRLRFWNAALIDGFRGNFDNDKPRGWMPKA